MRKYIISFGLISIGLILLITNFFQENKGVYPETIFKKNATDFDTAFQQLTSGVQKNIKDVVINYSDTNFIKNASNNEAFFIKLLKENSELLAISFIQNKYRLHIYQSDKSIVMGIDSSETIDIVDWHRYKNNKIVSSWQESFDNKIANASWYHKVISEPNKIHWIFNIERQSDIEYSNDNELFYGGYSFGDTLNPSVVLLRFSRMNLLSHFGVYKKYDEVNLYIETFEGKRMNLGSGVFNTFKDIDSTINYSVTNDSLNNNIMHHFSRFDGVEKGIFNFTYDDKVYWNSFKRFTENYGIKYFLLTIPNSEIINNTKSVQFMNTNFPSGVGLLLIGIILLFVNKQRFYTLLQKKLPPINLLLEDDENRYLEFKSSLRWDYRQEKVNPALEQVIFKTIAAFGNTDGGFLLIGVDDDKNILGLDKDFSTLKKNDSDYFEVHLRNLLHTLMGVKYVSKYIRMNFELIEGKAVCKIKILKAGEPLFLKVKDKSGKNEEKFYVRSGNSSQQIKSIADINDYINTRWK